MEHETGQQIALSGATLPITFRPFVVPALPPRPVFDEHIENFLAQTCRFTECKSPEDFAYAKVIGTAGAKLKNQITNSYRELKQAIDAIKSPVLDAENQDTLRILNEIRRIDGLAIAWNQEQQRLAQEEFNRREVERLQKVREEREAEAKMARMWEDDEAAKKIEAEPIPEARQTTVESGFTYRKGSRKPSYKAQVVKPDEVARKYCDPSQSRINIEVNSYFHMLKNPTPEQIKEIADKIGGVKIVLE